MCTTQGYVSDELSHFVGRGKEEQEQFEVLQTIIRTHTLKSWYEDRKVRALDFEPDTPLYSGELTEVAAVCFCDIPERDLGLHMSKYSNFGLSFTKTFLTEKGARPVIYIPKSSRAHITSESREIYIPMNLRELIRGLADVADKVGEGGHTEQTIVENNKVSDDQDVQKFAESAARHWPFLLSEFFLVHQGLR